MAFNGSGTFSIINTFVPGTTILSSAVNQNYTDIATGLSNAMCKDGQQISGANQNMGNFKFTNLASGTARTDSISVGQAQDALVNWIVAGSTGSVNSIIATYSPALTALVDGQFCCFRALGANTSTAPTFAPNGLAAHTITKIGGQALLLGDIPGNFAECILRYNLANTRWELLNAALPAQPAPTVQRFTSGSAGTYTPPSGVVRQRIRMVGGGAGGNSQVNAATAGGQTSFGTWTANGGSAPAGSGGLGGTGGTNGSVGTLINRISGGIGGGNITNSVAGINPFGGWGGNSAFGGAGSSMHDASGTAAAANSGSGGGGAGGSSGGPSSAPGGGAGEYAEFWIAVSSAMSYIIGSVGLGAASGSVGFAGGNGGAGLIIVEEFYI
jgi:hypothetical protein